MLRRFEYNFFDVLRNLKMNLKLEPLNLGGVTGSGGGVGGPPGGYTGTLPQTRVSYDLSEVASSGIPLSGLSLLDNLNHIRYRLQTIESGGVTGASPLIIQDNGVTVISGVAVVNFEGAMGITTLGEDGVTITISGGSTTLSGGNADLPAGEIAYGDDTLGITSNPKFRNYLNPFDNTPSIIIGGAGDEDLLEYDGIRVVSVVDATVADYYTYSNFGAYSFGDSVYIEYRKANGSEASPTKVLTNDTILDTSVYAVTEGSVLPDGFDYVSVFREEIIAEGDFTIEALTSTGHVRKETWMQTDPDGFEPMTLVMQLDNTYAYFNKSIVSDVGGFYWGTATTSGAWRAVNTAGDLTFSRFDSASWVDLLTLTQAGITVANHHISHEDGGADEINVAGLAGLLADEQNAGWIRGILITPGFPSVNDTLIFNGSSFVFSGVTASGGGVTDHGLLTGLSDDDHTQYHNDSRADTWFASKEATYVPASLTVTYGTLDSGTFGDLAAVGGTDVSISEATGVNAIQLSMTFTGVTLAPNSILLYGNYNGGINHTISVELLNNTTGLYDEVGILTHSTVKKWYNFAVFSGANYVNSGTVTMRLRHGSAGNNTHDLILDYVVIQKTLTTGGGTVIEHGELKGLTDPDHPASGIYTDTTNFNGILSASDGTVQKALETLDGITILDQYVKISSADTTTGYLEDKLIAGSGITLTKLNTGANEQIQITASGTSGPGASSFIDLTDTPSSYTGHDGKFVKVNSGATALEFVAREKDQIFFTVDGNVDGVAGKLKLYNLTGVTKNITKVHLVVDTAPTGADLIVDIHKNGTTIFTTQSNRPKITAGNATGFSTTIEVAGWADGEYLTMDVDQVGSTVAGADLVVAVLYD